MNICMAEYKRTSRYICAGKSFQSHAIHQLNDNIYNLLSSITTYTVYCMRGNVDSCAQLGTPLKT
jgi:hypothetical protein